MPKSKYVDFKAVKAAITIEGVLEHYGLLDKFKRSGDRLSGACPIHKGSNPTQFSVSVSKNAWNCFSECKHGGNTLDFIAEMENVSILAAANLAIEWFHLDPEAVYGDSEPETGETGEETKNGDTARPKPAARPAPAQENGAPNKPLQFRLDKLQREHPYLAERELTLETIVDFGVGFCAKGMMADRIAIPIHNSEGNVVARMPDASPGEPSEENPKYKLPAGFQKIAGSYSTLTGRRGKEPVEVTMVIVEGFFGCMKLQQHGCRKVVALMGSTMSSAQEELIRKHTDPNSQVIVMLDEDEAGRAGREDIATRLSKFCFVKVHAFEQDGQQPEDLSLEDVNEIFGGFQ